MQRKAFLIIPPVLLLASAALGMLSAHDLAGASALCALYFANGYQRFFELLNFV